MQVAVLTQESTEVTEVTGWGGSPVAGPRSAESAERLPGEAIQAGLSVGCIGSTVRTKHVKRK